MAEWIKMPLGMEVGLGPGEFGSDGDPSPLPKTGTEPPPQFSAHVHCGQTAGWIRMPLGTEVGLGPGGILLDGDSDTHGKRHNNPHFSAHFALARSPVLATAEHLCNFVFAHR